ncbi:MAG: cohesin domain-containing protein [Candidatus Acidiferrales bacterium]
MCNPRPGSYTRYVLLLCAAALLPGCHKSNSEFDAGRKAEAIQDYDTALIHYEVAARANPTDAEYKLRVVHIRCTAAAFHMERGQKALQKGDLEFAMSEFEKAHGIDPSNVAAEQQMKKTADLLAVANGTQPPAVPDDFNSDEKELMSGPPQLEPLSHEPINLKMTNDSRVVFETIAKLAGLCVIFDPDYVSRRVTAELPGVTLEQALDAVSFETKAFWKPLTSTVIEIAPDNPQKRKDIEDEQVATFYVANSLTPQDLTEMVNGLRQLLDLHRIQQVNAQNAIIVRDTPDKLDLAAKVIADMDKAKPEVLLHVQVLSANRDRLRQLGILPSQNVSLAFNPRCSVQSSNTDCTSSSSSSSTNTNPLQVTLNNLKRLSTADYSITLPGAAAEAVLTDNDTKIIQDPEIRVTDGEKAVLKIGQRVPVATGSTQAATGVGGASSVASLVNTQFQYIDVGVNIEAQPRVHPDGSVSLKLSVEVSAVANYQNIGGISEPVISHRKIEHEVRLENGEVNILGGLIERTTTNDLNGIPGAASVPGLKYLFSQTDKEVVDNEVLIILTPHILRFPGITKENLRRLASGSDSNVRVFRDDVDGGPSSDKGSATINGAPPVVTPAVPPFAGAPSGLLGSSAAADKSSDHRAVPFPTLALNQPTVLPASASVPPAAEGASPAAPLHFNPENIVLKPGDSTTVGLAISGVHDIFSLPLLVKYDPAVMQIDDVRDGGFLSGGTEAVAIVQRIDAQKGEVMISCTRRHAGNGAAGGVVAGVNGSGTMLGLVVRAVAPGESKIQIVEVQAQDSQQQAISVATSAATVRVQ